MRATDQRMQNLQLALAKLKQFAMEDGQSSEVIRAGIIQAFEFTFELFWKVFQSMAVDEGLSANSPKSALKAAFKLGLFADDQIWLGMLEDRNLTVHTYKAELAKEIHQRVVGVYLPEMLAALGALEKRSSS